MKFIRPYYEIITPIDAENVLKRIEQCGRTCYKSEAGEDTADKFCRMLVKHGHESVLEHCSFTVKFVTDRAVSHEIVRHRLASYSQESQRYCNYINDKCEGGVTFIIPSYIEGDLLLGKTEDDVCTMREHYGTLDFRLFNACSEAEYEYNNWIKFYGLRPEQARAVLPNCSKTEIVMTANIREWRHFLKLRTSKAAHPDLRVLTVPLLKELQKEIPALFDDIEVEP